MKSKKTAWNDDTWTRRARAEGYVARSAFKLEELDTRFRLLRPGLRVLDLGCAPGSWLQYCVGKVGKQGQCLGIDLKECRVAGAETRVGDMTAIPAAELGGPWDLVLSDMAPNTTGRPFVDAMRSLDLVRTAWHVARDVLVPGGAFASKVFQGEDLDAFVKEIAPAFARFERLKPKASREKSVEIFLVGMGFKGPG